MGDVIGKHLPVLGAHAMGQRQKTSDRSRLSALSGLVLRGSSRSSSVARKGRLFPENDQDLAADCEQWIALDKEIEGLASRWSDLESLSACQLDYFKMDTLELKELPLASRMEAIDTDCRRLGSLRMAALNSLGKRRPRTIHDVFAQLMVVSRLLELERGTAWPLVRNARKFLSRARCPECDAAYRPRGKLRA